MKPPGRAPAPCARARSSPRGRRSPRRRRLPSLCRACCRRRRARTGRSAWSLRTHAYEGLAATFGHQLVVLIVGAVVELDDPGARPRFRFALADGFGRAMDGVALE